MTPAQVQFCYFVAHGNAAMARKLLPELERDDTLFHGTRSPAIFCLWAAKQPDRHSVLKKLAELYPNVPTPQKAYPAVPASIEKTVCEILVPAIQPHLRRLLSSIVNANPKEIRSQHHAKAGFDTVSCAAALQFILSHRAFKNSASEWKELTTRVLQQLLTLTKTQLAEASEAPSLPQKPPASVTAVLRENNTGFTPLFPSVKPTPTPSHEDNNENDRVVDITQHKVGAASRGFFTSRPLHGRQSLTSANITPDLHGSTPPPAPQCVNQALSSFELVAGRVPTPLHKLPKKH